MASGRVLKLLSQLWKAQCDAPLVCLELKKELQRLPRQTGFKADQRLHSDRFTGDYSPMAVQLALRKRKHARIN